MDSLSGNIVNTDVKCENGSASEHDYKLDASGYQTTLAAPIVVGNFNDTMEERSATEFNDSYRQDVLVVHGTTGPQEVTVFGINVNPSTDVRVPETWEPPTSFGFEWPNAGIAVAANMDEDTDVLEYTGRKEIVFSDPHVLAVMAAPPYYADSGQTNGNIDTSFGRETGSTVSSTQSIGVSAGVTIGVAGETPLIGSLGAEVRATITAAATYNENNGENPDIDETILDHAVGDPGSYPSSKDALLSEHGDGYVNGPLSVGLSESENLGSLELGISETEGESTTDSAEFSHTAEVTRTTTFSGTIPFIPLTDSGNPVREQYKVGLFVFQGELAYPEREEDAANRFPVITYWVE